MLTIRFSRTGKKKQPQYRVIVSEKHRDPWGKYLELLGDFNPHTKEVNLKADRIKYWLSVGAQTSNSVYNLLLKQGIVEGAKKKSVSLSKKRIAKKAVKDGEAAAKAKPAEEPKAEAPKAEAEKPAAEPVLTKEAQ